MGFDVFNCGVISRVWYCWVCNNGVVIDDVEDWCREWCVGVLWIVCVDIDGEGRMICCGGCL